MTASAGVLALGTVTALVSRAGGPPAAPSDVTAIRTDDTTVSVAWTDPSRKVRDWSIMIKFWPDGQWGKWHSIRDHRPDPPGRHSVTFENMREKKVYGFKIIAHNGIWSTSSAPVYAVSAPPLPPSKIAVAWSRPPNDMYVSFAHSWDWEWCYKVYTSRRPGGAWELNNDTQGTIDHPVGRILLRMEPLTPDAEYCVRVVAWNPFGQAQPSETDCGKTSAN